MRIRHLIVSMQVMRKGKKIWRERIQNLYRRRKAGKRMEVMGESKLLKAF
jgi:hypothetical protein